VNDSLSHAAGFVHVLYIVLKFALAYFLQGACLRGSGTRALSKAKGSFAGRTGRDTRYALQIL